ncbi:MAG: hypothetical protein JJE22_05640, partial [Bacteroidia bacterium]|nr:hypothetical protein [Bacteroidia bacterium]
MKFLLFTVILLTSSIIMAQNSENPLTNHIDIGNPKLKGETTFNTADQ